MKNNLGKIALVTVFSIILWASISLSGEYNTTIKIPIQFYKISDSLSVSTISQREVSIRLSGKGWDLASLTFGREHIFTINTSKKIGKNLAIMKDEAEINSWIPSNINISEITPREVEYYIEDVAFKKIKISHDLVFNFKTGYNLVSDIKLTPDSITVVGPKSLIKSLSVIHTEKTNFEDLENPVNQQIKLNIDEGLQLSQLHTNINFDVQKIVDQTFYDIPINTVGVPPTQELEIFPAKINVILRGGINMLGKLDPEVISANINYRQALYDTLGVIQPMIEIPKFTILIDHQPRQLEYIIKKF